MRPEIVSITGLTNSATAICASQTTGAAGSLILNGAAASNGVATLGAAQIVGIASSGNNAGVDFAITGMNADGKTISETIAGPNNGTVITTNYFKAVTSITTDAAVTQAVTVGALAADGGVSRTVCLNWRAQYFNVTFDVNFSEGASATAAVDVSYHDPNDPNELPMVWYQNSTIATTTADKAANIKDVTAAARLRITSYTSGAVKLLVSSGSYAVGG